MNVKLKMALLMGLLVTIVVTLISAVGYMNFRSSSVDNYTASLETESVLIAKAIEQKVGRYLDALHVGADQLAINENGILDVPSALTLMTSINKHLGADAIGAHLGLENGSIYASRQGGLAPINAKETQREWWLRGFKGEDNIITKPFLAGKNKEPAITFAVPVQRGGKVVSVLCVNVKQAGLTEFIAGLTEKNQIFVNRKDGSLLAAQNPEHIGQNLFELRPSYSEHKSSVRSHHYYNDNDTDYYVVSSLIDSLGWKVWSWDTQQNINAASIHNLTVSAGIALLSILISLSFTILLVSKLMYKPIGGEPNEIEALVKQIADGNLTTSNQATGEETGVYAAVLAMSDRLKVTVTRINETAEQVNQTSVQLGTSVAKVNHSTENQMQQIEQTATAMNQMTVTVNEVARNAQEASRSADEAYAYSSEGVDVVNAMNRNIKTLVGGIEEVQIEINDLADATDGIGSILDVIREIAEQTNLLALNAAIEAARAGEQGRGFAVVADEVRNLATRTQESTEQIQEVITRLQKEASSSVKLMESSAADARTTVNMSGKANEALEAIGQSIQAIQDMNSQIATAAEQQTLTSGEINGNIIAINDLAKETFKSANDNSGMARDLSGAADSLNKSVEVFKL